MLPSNPVGFHTKLTKAMHQSIIDAIPLVLTPKLIAKYCRIVPQTLLRWLVDGARDAEQGEDTLFAQLYYDFDQKLAHVAQDLIDDLKTRKTNWQAPYELLKIIAREDFGTEAQDYKELLEMYKKLSNDLKRLIENPLQGVGNNGREMDKESD
jgi:hypothetical protein